MRALLFLLAAGCADYTRAQSAHQARVEAESHIDFFEPHQAEPGDGVVRVLVHHGFCSGALVGDAVVVTAQHCISEIDGEGRHTMSPGYVYVELGKEALPWARVSATRVLACSGWDGGYDHDIAAIVLDHRVPRDVPRFRVRLDERDVGQEGAVFVARGFGTAMSMRTMPMTGDAIWSTHLAERSGTLTWGDDDAFAMRMPSSHGDSGGPVLAEKTNDVVGVTSQSREAPNAPLTVASRIAPCASVLEEAAALEVAVR